MKFINNIFTHHSGIYFLNLYPSNSLLYIKIILIIIQSIILVLFIIDKFFKFNSAIYLVEQGKVVFPFK